MQELTELEKQLVLALQQGIPLVSRPYLAIAQKIGLTETQLMAKINELIDRGVIRRFGAALRHQDLGYTANAMVVWDIPDEQTAEIGKLLAALAEITHCYKRPRQPDWPYNIFTVIHGQSREECLQTVAAIAKTINVPDDSYRLLFSTRELKKISMKYFLD